MANATAVSSRQLHSANSINTGKASELFGSGRADAACLECCTCSTQFHVAYFCAHPNPVAAQVAPSASPASDIHCSHVAYILFGTTLTSLFDVALLMTQHNYYPEWQRPCAQWCSFQIKPMIGNDHQRLTIVQY